MNDEIRRRLEAGLNRRSFLRGSGLAAAAVLGIAAAPLAAFAQTQDKPPADKKKDETEKQDKDKAAAEDEDPTKVTKLDADGNEYRQCPQCGYNMYREGRMWTCENCGYTYIE